MTSATTGSLQESFARQVELYNSGRFDEYFAHFSDEVTYVIGHTKAITGKHEVENWYRSVMKEVESYEWDGQLNFTVVGDTGYGSGPFRQVLRSKSAGDSVYEGQTSVVYSWDGHQWMKVGEHFCYQKIG